jgi:Domain of unknown function (DUF6265)
MKLMTTILLLSASVFAQNALDKVSWLAGCWGGEMDGGKYEECWTSPTANFMQGSGRMTKGAEILMREHITIEKEGGDLVMYVFSYGAKLKPDQETVGFKLVKFSESELVFENPEHDYPQRIVYTKKKDGNLVARIELIDGKKPVSFPLNKPTAKKP